jgi:hypothetical protein
MFEIVCEVANMSGKTLTIETSIPEAEKPDIQILKSGQQLGVFASPTRSTVKITVASIEKDDRIEKLEAALREIIGALDDPKGGQHVYDMRNASYIARKALEGKND